MQAAPVLIKNAPQLSLDGLPPVADVTLYPRRQDRLESRTVLTGLTALEKTTNDVANRIYSSATFDRGPSLQSKLATDADKMGEPMGLPKTPKVHGWSDEEMEPFRAIPSADSAQQLRAPSEVSAGPLEAQVSHELSLAPERQLSFRDSASQPSSPAHEGDDHGKHAPLDALSPKLLSIKEPALGDIPGTHVTNSRTTSAHAETSHSERTAEAETGTYLDFDNRNKCL